MARQKGIIKLQGRVGDLSFYKTKDGYLAREKGGIDGQRIASDPAFQRTRENGMEFGNAGSSEKLLRNALRVVAQKVKDSRMTSRLTREMLKVVKSDTRSIRGERNILEGDLVLLKGFEFNEAGKLGTSLFIPFEVKIRNTTPYLNKNISDINFWHHTTATVIAIKRNNTTILSPGPYADFRENDIFYFVGDENSYRRVMDFLYPKEDQGLIT